MKIAIISSSVREGRLSHRAALFFREYFKSRGGVETDLIDLLEYNFPIFNERLPYMKNPTADVVDFAGRIGEADGVVIVSPVYNAGFPASLKNVVDLLVSEWIAKPVMIVTVSSGSTAGIATAMQLQALMLRMKARVAAPTYTVTEAATAFSPDGTPADPKTIEHYTKPSVEEFMWLVEKSYAGGN